MAIAIHSQLALVTHQYTTRHVVQSHSVQCDILPKQRAESQVQLESKYPEGPAALQAEAVRSLLAHRLTGNSSAAAKTEWNEIVEGEHPLWQGVSEPYKHTIRSFLVYFNTQIQRQATERFKFKNGSVGESACTFPESQGVAGQTVNGLE